MAVVVAMLLALTAAGDASKLAEAYVDAVAKLNEEHARKPGATNEDQLAAKLPKKASQALDALIASEGDDAPAALVRAGEGALDLARMDDFARVRERVLAHSPDHARTLGVALARDGYLLRGVNGLDDAYLEHFSTVLDAILGAYDELFGFSEWSKVPGKKLRVRIHLEAAIERPPHFAPEFPWHSEIDFPVVDSETFRSPTGDGKFLFYGLCHELGHVIAMWGSPSNEEDHHAWAHYTGVAIVEHLSKQEGLPWMENARDVKWRSLTLEREAAKATRPSLADKDGTLALLIALHDRVGPRTIGTALNALDAEDKRQRVNHVRYYTFAELEKALVAATKDSVTKKWLAELLR